MSEENTSKTIDNDAPETVATPQLVPLAGADRELSDAELDNVAGGFAPAPARKAGGHQKDFLILPPAR